MVRTNYVWQKRPWQRMASVWLFTAVMLGFSSQLFAGNYQKFSSASLLTQEAGKANAKLHLRKASKSIRKGDWHLIEAAQSLDSLVEYNPDYAPLRYKAGYTYVQLGDGAKALHHLAQCDSLVSKSFFLTRGRAYHLNHQLDSALLDYNRYKKSLKKSQLKKVDAGLKRLMYQCKNQNVVLNTKEHVAFSSFPAGINTKYNDFSPVMLHAQNKLLYTSNQPVLTKQLFFKQEKLKDRGEEILTFSLDESADSADIKQFSSFLSSRHNEGAVTTSPNENEVIVFRGQMGEGDFYATTFADGEWQRPVPFLHGKLATKYKESDLAYINSDIIVFSSEKKKGYGGKDIYMIKKEGKKWGKPESLGQKINTEFDEKVCSYSPENNRLFFASNNPGALGGYDIFYVLFNSDGSYGYPEQLGYPVNTANNEYDFVYTEDTTIAIISSDRPGTKGGLDLWYTTFLDPMADQHFSLSGYVKSAKDGAFIPGAKIDFRSVPEDTSITVITADTLGNYYNRFDKKGTYRAIVSAEGYNDAREVISISILEKDTVFVQDFSLTEIIVEDFSVDLMGLITNEKDETPISANISISKANSDSTLLQLESDSLLGKYFATLPDKRDGYLVNISAEGFHPKSYILNKPATETVWTENIALAPIEENVMLFSGTITDANSGKGLPASLLLTNPITQQDSTIYADSTSGYYQYEIKERVGLVAEIKVKGYFTINSLLKIPTNLDEWITYNNFELQPLKAGESIVLDNILFQSGRSIILKESYTTLDKIVNVLQENPAITVEISGHTDSSGSLELNQRLSKNRAKAVADHLIQKGVSTSRISSKGYGPSMPIETNTTREGRAKNRRVEFKILED